RSERLGEIDPQHDAVAKIERSIDESRLRMHDGKGLVGKRKARLERRLLIVAAKAQLVELRSRARPHREGARRNFGEEGALIAALDKVEALRAVGDEPRENVEPSGRALRVRGAGDALWQSKAFEERNDVKASAFEHRPVADKVNLVGFELRQHLRHAAAFSRKKARADAIGLWAKPKIEARRLNLAVGERRLGKDRPVADEFRYLSAR